MQKTKKMSLADLKAKANKTNEKEILEKVQGGGWDDCHGYWGQLRKAFSDPSWDAYLDYYSK